MTEYEKMEREMKEYPEECLGKIGVATMTEVGTKRRKPLFIVPVKWEIYDDSGEFLLGDMEGFDEDSITLNIKGATMSPEELGYLASVMEGAKIQYRDGL